MISSMCFISKIELKNVKETTNDEFGVNTMQEELIQFERNEVWELVPRPKFAYIIGTKWIYKHKFDKNGTVTRKKGRLAAQDYAQMEWVDLDEIFSPISHLEPIRLLQRLSFLLKFRLYQMDEKSAFLNGYLNVEDNQDVSNDVNDMKDFIVKYNVNLMIVHIYVDDIVFGRMSRKIVDQFFSRNAI